MISAGYGLTTTNACSSHTVLSCYA